MTQSSPDIEVSCQDVKQKLADQQNLLLLDCREPSEHQIVSIPEAKLLPMGEISTRAEELEEFKQLPIIVFCHHGGRSLRVANWLRSQGYSQAASMAGGIDAWAVEISPGMARY